MACVWAEQVCVSRCECTGVGVGVGKGVGVGVGHVWPPGAWSSKKQDPRHATACLGLVGWCNDDDW